MPKLLLGRNVAVLVMYLQPRSRIVSLEELSVSLESGNRLDADVRSHTTESQGHATSCFSISSLMGSRGPGGDATAKFNAFLGSS